MKRSDVFERGKLPGKLKVYMSFEVQVLRRNPPDVGVTSGQKSSTKVIYIVLQTSLGLV